jgi:hypothetical protein
MKLGVYAPVRLGAKTKMSAETNNGVSGTNHNDKWLKLGMANVIFL